MLPSDHLTVMVEQINNRECLLLICSISGWLWVFKTPILHIFLFTIKWIKLWVWMRLSCARFFPLIMGAVWIYSECEMCGMRPLQIDVFRLWTPSISDANLSNALFLSYCQPRYSRPALVATTKNCVSLFGACTVKQLFMTLTCLVGEPSGLGNTSDQRQSPEALFKNE